MTNFYSQIFIQIFFNKHLLSILGVCTPLKGGSRLTIDTLARKKRKEANASGPKRGTNGRAPNVSIHFSLLCRFNEFFCLRRATSKARLKLGRTFQPSSYIHISAQSISDGKYSHTICYPSFECEVSSVRN